MESGNEKGGEEREKSLANKGGDASAAEIFAVFSRHARL
jgi:hypothetical protein